MKLLINIQVVGNCRNVHLGRLLGGLARSPFRKPWTPFRCLTLVVYQARGLHLEREKMKKGKAFAGSNGTNRCHDSEPYNRCMVLRMDCCRYHR